LYSFLENIEKLKGVGVNRGLLYGKSFKNFAKLCEIIDLPHFAWISDLF
jgi:hypothetical protein